MTFSVTLLVWLERLAGLACATEVCYLFEILSLLGDFLVAG